MELRQRTREATKRSQDGASQTDFRQTDGKSSARSKLGLSCGIFWKVVALVLFIYVVLPAFFYKSSWMRQHVVYLTFLNIPPFPRLSDPDSYNLSCPRLFSIESEPNIKLGAWYIPANIDGTCDKSKPMFADDHPVVLYLHGNSGSRAGRHRVDLYKVLSTEAKVHVVTFDYRGYGDSSTHTPPSVDGLLTDALAMYQFVRKTVPAKRITIYGHSLGTGIGTKLLAKLQSLEDNPAALILESPFDKISNVVKRHPLSAVHRNMPMFQELFVDAVQNDPKVNFDSLQQAEGVSTKLPVMILHAKDDSTIPFDLGERLFRKFESLRRSDPKKGPLEFIQFESQYRYGHKYICTHKGIAKTFRDFIEAAIASNVDVNA